jgi:hypothetical protein
VAPIVGPIRQNRGTDVRWTVGATRENWGILYPSALSPDTSIRSHDPGMYQPSLFRPNPFPDYFTSVVIESALYESVEFYLVGNV